MNFKHIVLKAVQLFLRKNAAVGKPISGQVDRMSASETVDFDMIPGRVKPKTVKNWYSQLSCLTFSNVKGHYEASTVCDRQVGTGQMAA